MNVRQQKYKFNRIGGMSAYKAAIEAGYSHATAWNAHKNIEKRCNFDELMVKQGLDDEYLLSVLKNGIQVVDSLSGCPNLTTKAFLEIAFKLNGRLKDKVEHTGKIGGGTTVNVYPNKTIVFAGINESTDKTSDLQDIYATQGEDSSRVGKEISSP